MLTLITKSPDTPDKTNTQLRLKFGYSSNAYNNNEKVLHTTLTATKFTQISNTGHSLKVVCDESKISIVSENNTIEASWYIDTLKDVMTKKLGDQFVFVRAESKGTGEDEEFLFTEPYFLDGFNSDAIINLVKTGDILVDLRIGQYHSGKNKGKTHDHGTGFRIFEKSYHLIFNMKKNNIKKLRLILNFFKTTIISFVIVATLLPVSFVGEFSDGIDLFIIFLPKVYI